MTPLHYTLNKLSSLRTGFMLIPFVGSVIVIFFTPRWFWVPYIGVLDGLCILLLAINSTMMFTNRLAQNIIGMLLVVQYALFTIVGSHYHFDDCQIIFLQRLEVCLAMKVFPFEDVYQNMMFADRLQMSLFLLVTALEYNILKYLGSYRPRSGAWMQFRSRV